METEYFWAEIYVDSDSPSIEGAIECRIHAENLSKPAKRVIPVRITAAIVDTLEHAEQLVKDIPQPRGV